MEEAFVKMDGILDIGHIAIAGVYLYLMAAVMSAVA